MITPALRAIRKAHPTAEIILCGEPHLEDLFESHPSVDRFQSIARYDSGSIKRIRRTLREELPDWAVIFPDSFRAALPAFLARVPFRVGYSRDPLRKVLLTHSLPPPSGADGRRIPISMVERYLRISRYLGCPDDGEETELVVGNRARSSLGQRLDLSGLSLNDPLFVMTPGASFGSSKLWPVEHFAAAADQLSRDLNAACVITPGPGEEDIAKAVESLMSQPVRTLIQPTVTLSELVALLSRSLFLVSNDTGPRHIAVALGTPAITVMGSTDPRHTQHLMKRQKVLREDVSCSPCHLKLCPIDHRCMTRLKPERVVAAAKELLGMSKNL